MFVLSIHCEVPFSRERRRPILHHDPVLDSSFGVRRTQPQYEVFIPPEHDECLGFVGADGAAYTIAPLQSSLLCEAEAVMDDVVAHAGSPRMPRRLRRAGPLGTLVALPLIERYPR